MTGPLLNSHDPFLTEDAGDIRKNILEFPNRTDAELKRIMRDVEIFAPEIIGMRGYNIQDRLYDVKRAGWIRPEVGIPEDYAETIAEHGALTEKACRYFLKGFPHKVQNHEDFPIMGRVHDVPEGHKVLPDITPYDNYTREQKELIERYVILSIGEILGYMGDKNVSLMRRYAVQHPGDHDALQLTPIDKLAAGVKALDYERIGFQEQVAHFHPYTVEAIKGDKDLSKIYQILLEREFSTIDPHFQYFTLLELGGNYNEFRNRMNDILRSRK